MLDKLARIARPLTPAARPCLVIAIIGAVVFMMGIGDIAPVTEQMTIPALALTAWMLCLHSFIRTFQAVPARPATNAPLTRRISGALSRCVYLLLAMVTIGVSVLMLFLTLRLVLIWANTYNV